MLWALDLSSGDFGAFPHKQRPSILSAGRERASMNRISILKKKKKEKRKGESGGDLHLKGEVLMMLWPQCFYSSTAGMHWAQWLVIDQAKPILKNGAIRQKWEGKTREEF